MAALLTRRWIIGLILSLLLWSPAGAVTAAVLASFSVVTLVSAASALRPAALGSLMTLAGGVGIGLRLAVGRVAFLLLASIVVITGAQCFSSAGLCCCGL
jgi:hypothetical protein